MHDPHSGRNVPKYCIQYMYTRGKLLSSIAGSRPTNIPHPPNPLPPLLASDTPPPLQPQINTPTTLALDHHYPSPAKP